MNINFGYLSSFVKWTDGKPCLRNVQRKSLWKEITSFTENQQIKLASFVSFFTRREVVEDVGLPIKDFFIWGDDWEYSSRVAKKYTSYFVCDSVVTHKCKNNRGCNIIQDNGRLERYFYAYRNEYYFYRKNGFSGHLYEFLKVNYHRLKLLLKGNSKKKRKMIRDGIKAGKSFHPEIEHYYSKNHSTKVLVFFGEPLSYGGQEAFRINRYSNFNDKNIHYTFVTPFHADNVKFRQRIKDKGDNLVHFEYPFESKKRKSYIVKAAKSVLKSNEYDVIHIQSGSVYTLLEVAKLAKKYGVKKVIVHSHAAGFNNFKYRLIKNILISELENMRILSLPARKLPENGNSLKKYYRVINTGLLITEYRHEPISLILKRVIVSANNYPFLPLPLPLFMWDVLQ